MKDQTPLCRTTQKNCIDLFREIETEKFRGLQNITKYTILGKFECEN